MQSLERIELAQRPFPVTLNAKQLKQKNPGFSILGMLPNMTLEQFEGLYRIAIDQQGRTGQLKRHYYLGQFVGGNVEANGRRWTTGALVCLLFVSQCELGEAQLQGFRDAVTGC